MKMRFFTENGEVKHEYEYIPTPLGTEEESAQVKSFADDTAKYYICNDCQLGEYEYEILGADEFSLRRKKKRTFNRFSFYIAKQNEREVRRFAKTEKPEARLGLSALARIR